MKRIIVVLVTMLSVTTCEAAFGPAEKAVPENVLKSFSQQYSQAHAKKWGNKQDTFIAQFKMGKRQTSAFYLSNGNWIKTESKIRWSWQLPKQVRNGWDNCSLCSWYIDEIKQIDSPNKKVYSIQVHKELGPDGAIPGDWVDVYVLYFDENGLMFKKDHKEG